MAGTDNIESLHDELAALVDAGLTPLEALRAATTVFISETREWIE